MFSVMQQHTHAHRNVLHQGLVNKDNTNDEVVITLLKNQLCSKESAAEKSAIFLIVVDLLAHAQNEFFIERLFVLDSVTAAN